MENITKQKKAIILIFVIFITLVFFASAFNKGEVFGKMLAK